jgi:HEAT repeat protein
MEPDEIERALQERDYQPRLKAIAALKTQSAEIAIPLLKRTLNDPEFLVRTFVAMGLGKHQSAESFAALLEMLKLDNTPNVRAEAANSLSLFGLISVSHLVSAYHQDPHWLVRRSILAALMDLDCPHERLEIGIAALNSEDQSLRGAAIDALTTLHNSEQWQKALTHLNLIAQDPNPRIRAHLARTLKPLTGPLTEEILNQLRQDPDPTVIAATWANP